MIGTQQLIAAHNHPSGDAAPSLYDDQSTRQLVRAGKILGVTLTDHIIIGGGTGTYYSYCERGKYRKYRKNSRNKYMI